jgi:hypothetical protein
MQKQLYFKLYHLWGLLLLEKPGPGGFRQKKLQNLDSMNQGRKNENYVLSTFRHLRISYRLLLVQV